MVPEFPNQRNVFAPPTFQELLKEKFQQGLLLLVKWGLLIAAIVYAFNYSLQTRNMAMNGEQAALAINEFINKGWLPKLANGEAPKKMELVK
jgi:hypothetical protein